MPRHQHERRRQLGRQCAMRIIHVLPQSGLGRPDGGNDGARTRDLCLVNLCLDPSLSQETPTQALSRRFILALSGPYGNQRRRCET
jgi:hypothetical protein